MIKMFPVLSILLLGSALEISAADRLIKDPWNVKPVKSNYGLAPRQKAPSNWTGSRRSSKSKSSAWMTNRPGTKVNMNPKGWAPYKGKVRLPPRVKSAE